MAIRPSWPILLYFAIDKASLSPLQVSWNVLERACALYSFVHLRNKETLEVILCGSVLSVLSIEMHTSSKNLSKASSTLQVGKVWPWEQAMSQVLSPESQLLRLG